MGARENLLRLIDRKQMEIRNLRDSIAEAEIYVQALQDAIKAIPREPTGAATSGTKDVEPRPGSNIYEAREAIRKAGRPLHINDILAAIGKPTDKKARVSLASTIAGYVRANQVFSRTGPNTFGLLQATNDKTDIGEVKLPAEFGA